MLSIEPSPPAVAVRGTTVALAVLVACGGADRAGDGEGPATEAPSEAQGETTPDTGAEVAPAWVVQLAEVANAIEERPAAADSILGAHEMTRAELDSLLYDVSADPALTRAYEAARR